MLSTKRFEAVNLITNRRIKPFGTRSYRSLRYIQTHCMMQKRPNHSPDEFNIEDKLKNQYQGERNRYYHNQLWKN